MSDHIPDAGKMVPTPICDEAIGFCRPDYPAVPYETAQELELKLAAANAEIARLKAGGCARDQRTTQFCGEAVELAQKLDAANARIALLISERDTARMQADRNYKLREEFVGLLGTEDIERGVDVVKALKSKVDYLQNWIRRLALFQKNHSKRRIWASGIGWLEKGQCAYVGPQKPEGLR